MHRRSLTAATAAPMSVSPRQDHQERRVEEALPHRLRCQTAPTRLETAAPADPPNRERERERRRWSREEEEDARRRKRGRRRGGGECAVLGFLKSRAGYQKSPVRTDPARNRDNIQNLERFQTQGRPVPKKP
ncbi:hypothetical protein NL676_033727 [Syzygium grande]|nr:hypothetical protein NL676_033727 [Syzygium grande]